MELKINCDTKVNIDKLNSLKSVDCNVISFSLDKNALNGDIRISGKYYKDDLDQLHEFSDVVPFTVMFNDENVVIHEVTCGNFSCQEVVNQGIECHFDVFIRYEKMVIEIPVEIPSEFVTVEDVKEVENEEKEIEIDLDNKEVEIDLEENEVEVENGNEEVYEEITQKFDDLLGEILDVRNDNFLDQNPKNESIVKVNPVSEKKERVASSRMAEKKATIKIYFPTSEQELDKICKDEKLNINDAYEEYRKNRRIIIK